MAAWRRSGRIEKHRERLIGAMEAKGISREFARARVRADPRLRRIRISREPRRELRADRVRDVVPAQPLSGRVHVLAAQRAADGLLLARDDRRRCAAPRRRVCRSTCARASGIARSRCAPRPEERKRSDSGAFRGAHGPALGQGHAARRGRADRRGAARSSSIEDFVRRAHVPDAHARVRSRKPARSAS